MSLTRMLAGASLAVVASLAVAQGATSRPDPLDPNAPPTSLAVPRTFDEYMSYKDPKVVPWKDTNAAVSTNGAAGKGDTDHGGMKHDMDTMAPAGASSPAAPVPSHAMPRGSAAQPSKDGKTDRAPATDHSTHKM